MKRLIFGFMLLVLVAIVGCSAPTPAPSRAAIAPAQPPAPAPGFQETSGQTKGAGDSTGTNAPYAQSADRMIVYNVRLSLEVQDADKTSNDIAAIVAQYKGYVSGSNLSRNSKGQMSGTVTVRVPAESLDEAQKKIEATGLKVLSRNKDSKDVTDQYTDLNARLKNLQATEAELTTLLTTVRERTGKAEDILAVYNQLTQIRGQIEQIKGQINVLDKTTALATITIDLVPHEDVQILEPDTWMPNKTVAQALKALVQALQAIADLAIWLVLFFLPVAIVLLLPFIVLALILRSIFKRRKKAIVPTT